MTITERFLRWFAQRYTPHLTVVDGKPAQSMREMAKKLNELKTEKEEWRQRAFSAEKVVRYELREALKTACTRHDEEHKTMLRFEV